MTAPDMTYACAECIRWMIGGVPRTAFHYLNGLPAEQIFRALAIPAREDIDDLFVRLPPAAAAGGIAPDRMAAMTYAFHVVKSGATKGFSPPAPGAAGWATQYLSNVVSARAAPFNTLDDLTGTLPAGGAAPPALTDRDYSGAAATLGVEVAAIKAVAQVESSGSGFGPRGRPIIRYELHVFQGKTRGHFHETHPYLSQPTLKAGNRYHNNTQKREYSMLFNAMLLDYWGRRAIEQAIESASWGKFQVMGDNWRRLGWSSAVQFALDMYASEANHLLAFVRFIQKGGLTNALKTHQWAAFAAGYNGSGYAVNHYDTNIENAYNRLTAGARP